MINLDQYPNLEIFLENLKLLKEQDFSSMKYDEIYAEYFNKLFNHLSTGGHLNNENFPNLTFYRVRTEKSILPHEHLDLIQTYSYPPANACKNGRGNIQGHPVFYCTDDFIAAVKESNMSKNEVGYLSIWNLRLRRELSFSTYLPENLPQKNTWTPLAKYFHYIFLAYINQIPKEFQEHIRAQQNFIIEKFLSETIPYNITSMICHSDLYKIGDVDFVVYPSAKTIQNYCNYAFHPNVAQNNLVIDRVIRFKVTSDDDEELKVIYGEVGNRKNDRI